MSENIYKPNEIYKITQLNDIVNANRYRELLFKFYTNNAMTIVITNDKNNYDIKYDGYNIDLDYIHTISSERLSEIVSKLKYYHDVECDCVNNNGECQIPLKMEFDHYYSNEFLPTMFGEKLMIFELIILLAYMVAKKKIIIKNEYKTLLQNVLYYQNIDNLLSDIIGKNIKNYRLITQYYFYNGLRHLTIFNTRIFGADYHSLKTICDNNKIINLLSRILEAQGGY